MNNNQMKLVAQKDLDSLLNGKMVFVGIAKQNMQDWFNSLHTASPSPVVQPQTDHEQAVAIDAFTDEAYWQFDAMHKGYGEYKFMPMSERDAFKRIARLLVSYGKGTPQPSPAQHDVKRLMDALKRNNDALIVLRTMMDVADLKAGKEKAYEIFHDNLALISEIEGRK